MALNRIVERMVLIGVTSVVAAACASRTKKVFSEAEQNQDAYVRDAVLSGAKLNAPLDIWAHAPHAFLERINPASKPQALLNFLAPINLTFIQTPTGRGQWWFDVAYQMCRDLIQNDDDGHCLSTYVSTIKRFGHNEAPIIEEHWHTGCAQLAEHHVRQFTDFDRKALIAAMDGYGQLVPRRLVWIAQQEARKIDQSYRMFLEKSRTP